jgi:DNA-binding CsgD family transcriptional regulator
MSAAVFRSRRDIVPALLGAVGGALGRGTGAPNGVVLTASAGAGKSRLLNEFRDRLVLPARYAAGADATSTHPFAVAAELFGAAEATSAAFLARVDELIAGQSLVLVVDDLHFADAETLGLLREVLTLDAPIVLVAARRPEPSRGMLDALVGLARVADWAVPDLDRLDIDVLVRDRTGAWPGPRLRTLLESFSGNAHQLIALVDRLVGAGDATGGDLLELVSDYRVPEQMSALTADDSLQRLNEAELDVARTLAVFGRATNSDDLAAVLAVDATTTLAPIQRLLDAGIVVARGEDLDFAQGSFRESVYASIPNELRRSLHRAVADRRSGPVERARHVIAAEPTSQDLLDAVRDAVDVLADAPGVTADLLAAAFSQTHDAAVAAELAVTRARALARSGQLQLAVEIAADALGWATEPEVAAELRRIAIFAASTRGQLDEGIALIDVALAGPMPDRPRRILTDHRRFLALLRGREPVPLEALAADPRELTLNGLIAELLRRFLLGDTGVALEYAWAASRRSLAGSLDPNEGLSADLWTPFVALAHAGADVARDALHQLILMREERGATWQTAGHHAVAGAIDVQAARLDDAAAQFDTALDVAARMELGSMSQAASGRALVDVLRGDIRAARARIESWTASEEFGLPALDRARVAVLEAERRYTDAARLAAAAWSRAGSLHLFGWQATVGPDFARVALRASDVDLARLIHDDLARTPEPAGRPGRAAASLARLLSGADYPTLQQIGPDLAAEAEAVGNRLLSLLALEESAVAAAVTNDQDLARVLARQAIALAEDAGAIGIAARIAGRLRSAGTRLGSRTSRARPDFGWDSLTPTEDRIVGLVASGVTGPGIAQQLHLSPRTVQTHVSHALAKLGLANRIELAAAAARRPVPIS